MKKAQNKLFLLISFIAGAIAPFAFAPCNWIPIIFISLALLVYGWLHASPRRAFALGYSYGLGFFTVGASWVYVSIHHFGNANTLLAGFITALFIIYLALYPAIAGYLLQRLFCRQRLWARAALTFPTIWVLCEWLRGLLFTGFPWLFAGYTQIATPLKGYAPIIGVYGVSWLVAFISALLLLIIIQHRLWPRIINIALIIITIGAGAALNTFTFTRPAAHTISISMIQGNIPQTLKWDSNNLLHILKVYQQATIKHWQSKIIIWPEAALPTFPQKVSNFINELNQQAKLRGSAIIIGTFTGDNKRYYNSMIVLGNGHGTYRKRQLVPFGEYIPLPSIYGRFMQYFNIPMADVSKGAAQQPLLMAANIPIAAFICYEIAYPQEVLNSANNSQLLVTVSDDSWFGNSFASAQQVQMAQMRALETGRTMLYSTNTGITAIINSRGNITSTLARNQFAVLTDHVTPMQGKTPLLRWHYFPLLALLVALPMLGFL